MQLSSSFKKGISVLLLITVLISAFSICALAETTSTGAATHTGTVFVDDNLNVRSGPATSYDKIGKLPNGTLVYICEQSGDWYKIIYGDGFGYVSGAYIINVKEIPKYNYSADFETNLTEQGFPESYKVLLRSLHAAHPNWIFMADHIKLTFDEAATAESAVGKSLVQNGYAPDSWKSMADGAYNWTNNTYTSYDSGGWVTAERDIVEYFMEPRNFLNENDIYVFLEQSFNPAVHTKEGLQKILNGTFMAGAFPEDTYDTYADILMEAAETYGVSPYVLAASILLEQGSGGTGKSISGTVSGYENYYNYFNIRAYASGDYSAVQYGLLYAKGEGSYGRPWNTRAKSILGGSEYYADGYVKRGQDTLYYKKFNVVTEPYYKNQYMTNVQAAYSEAKLLAQSYSAMDSDMVLTFSIPVYKDTSATNDTKLPTLTGANNYYLTSLSINGKAVTDFSKYKNEYIADYTTSSHVTISATVPSGASVSGTGSIRLKHGTNKIVLTVTAASGKTSQYTIQVEARLNGWVFGDGKWSYYENGNLVRNRWMKDSNGWCYIGADGYCVANGWAKDSKDWVYFDSNGRMVTNAWVKDKSGWYYVGSDGYCIKNAWKKDNKGWVYLGSDGKMATNCWLKDSVGWCYVGSDGYCITNAWAADSNGWCYLGADGRLVKNKWVKDSKGWCYIGADGYCVKNVWRKDSKGWVYLNSDGRVSTNAWVKDSAGWCYVGADGYCLTNRWVKDSKGWCYLDSNGRMLTSSWLTENGKKYYLDANGHMVTGRVKIGNKYYKFNSNGVLYG